MFQNQYKTTSLINLDGDPCSVTVSLYSYDTFGRRVTKAAATGVGSTTGEVTESYLYDGFQAIAEYTADGRIKRRFIYAAGIDEPVCMVVEPDHQGYYGLEEYSNIAYSWLCDPNDTCFDSQADYYADSFIDIEDVLTFASDYYLDDRPPLEDSKYYGYVFDGMSNVVAMTYMNDPNETGDPNEIPYFAETYTYDPFGEVTIYDAQAQQISQSAIGNPYLFTARRYDSESDLYYYRYRMYNPELGRFIQTDPIGYYDSMNLYQYCGNNPTNFVDPWGLMFNINPIIAEQSEERAREWHFNRNKRNIYPPTSKAAKDAGWERLSENKSIYHRQGVGNKNNQKWVSPDGHSEAIYNENGKKLVTDSVNMGTYNFSPSDNYIGHFVNDILPYYIFGNCLEDPTSMIERITAGYEGETE